MSIPIARKGSGTNLSSKPIGIGFGQGNNKSRTNNNISSNLAHVSASAPVFSWQPPPPPAARPRVPSFDPPPLELPSSPPIGNNQFLQQEDNSNDDASGMDFNVRAAQNKANIAAAPAAVYSRSLSNYSSSAPAHNIDYLAQFQKLALTSNNSNINAGGLAINGNPNAAQRGSKLGVDNGLSLGKSPTIFSILTQQVPEGNEDEEEPLEKPVRGIVHSSRATTQQNRVNNDDNNDLQFDISLEEEEDNPDSNDNSNYSLY
jgi:hypothetical protein